MAADFCPILDEMLSMRRTVGRSGKQFTELASNSTLNNLRFIQQTMRERKPLRTLEVGLAYGASTLVFCSEHRLLGRLGQRQHIAIDPFQRRPWYDEAGIFAVERAGLADYLDARSEFSEFVLPQLLEAGNRFDFIYVDGSHLFENVLLDGFYGVRLLNEGGIIAFDDSTDRHVAKVLRFMRKNLSVAVREIPPNGMKATAAWAIGKRQLTTFERLPANDLHAPLREWDAKFVNF